jgi:hypothetical protein
VNSTLKIQNSEAMTLLEKIKLEIKKRAEAKAKHRLLKQPKSRRNDIAKVAALISELGLLQSLGLCRTLTHLRPASP